MLQLLRIILNLPRLLRTRASLAVLFELIPSAAVGVVLGLVTDNPFVGFAAGSLTIGLVDIGTRIALALRDRGARDRLLSLLLAASREAATADEARELRRRRAYESSGNSLFRDALMDDERAGVINEIPVWWVAFPLAAISGLILVL
jgi:hypothetical protein